MKCYKMIFSALLTGCLSAAGCSLSGQESEAGKRGSAQSAESARKITAAVDSLFPKEKAADSYSQGIINLSSLWKAGTDLPVYENREDGTPQTDRTAGLLKKDTEFRVMKVATFPVGDPDPAKIYGQLADGRGWTVLYDQRDNPQVLAFLKEGSKWPQREGIELRSDSKDRQLLINLEPGDNHTVWAKTLNGSYPLYSESGPGFFSPIDGVVFGELSKGESLESYYRSVLVARRIKNWNKNLFWGYALADMSGDGYPELLISSGGLEKKQTVTVYGGIRDFLSFEGNGTFSMVNSRLFQDGSGLLRFQTESENRKITRIHFENGQLTETELSAPQMAQLDAGNLKEIEFVSINEYQALEAVKTITLGEAFPEYNFSANGSLSQTNMGQEKAPSGNGSSFQKDEGEEKEVSIQDWKLEYAMVIRADHDRTSDKLGTLPKSSQIAIIREYHKGQEIWGLLKQGGWICLKDADLVYAVPFEKKAEPESPPAADSWKETYRKTLQAIATDPQYSHSFSDWYPAWYLWTDSGYELPLLVVKTGSCEADFKLEFYIASGGQAQKIAETSAGHSSFYSTGETGQFDRLMAHMGVEAIDRFTLANGKLESKQLSSRTDVLDYQIPEGEIWEFQTIDQFQ